MDTLVKKTKAPKYLDKKETIVYPDSDGMPMADNTKQFNWIVLIKEGLEAMYAHDPNVFVAGDLLWYPVEGNPKIRKAPDVMVVFGRPKGDRGSYKQWEEENISPQVVFEINSPGNTPLEMSRKLIFYQNYGVQEYYFYDPDINELLVWIREGDHFKEIEETNHWQSPLMGIRFVLDFEEDTMHIYRPTGERFATYTEILEILTESQKELRKTQEDLSKTQEDLSKTIQEKEKLAEKLRELGIDPDKI
ncbi:Uma2 family endonuclease [Raineya orbicola]|uniref:Putative restriction endonuclease n=1 Tax=Raineya orbicola TaxID=2016530 RepID=A0A2N3ICQ3_9BACT|nr:Uma2 family endonuclease [Raineya orbicola]PKQ68069.1 putative restriction endonuclease [Raineya orbicola]